jgi:hypothetical protein
MAEEWLTYGELGERLCISAEAARQKAIRNCWPRHIANDGRAQVRVDVEETKAIMPARRSRDEKPADARSTHEPTPVEPPSDVRTFAALEAHIETLKALATAGEVTLARERERADTERARAEHERVQAEAERERSERLARRLEEAQERMAQRAELEQQLIALRAKLDEMQAARARPWWRRLTP